MYPKDCVQHVVGSDDWWIKSDQKTSCRGALVTAFVPYVEHETYGFEPLGRKEASQHDSAIFKVAPLRVGQPIKRTELPVAAMPLHGSEVFAAYRAKMRPCLVIGSVSPSVDKSLTKGKPKLSTAPTMLIAPFYGVEQNSQRAGYNPRFIERVRHLGYPQFLWDKLPPDNRESLLRLDHLQPIGTGYGSYKLIGYRLGGDALEIVDGLFQWLIWNRLPEDGLIAMFREEFNSTFDNA